MITALTVCALIVGGALFARSLGMPRLNVLSAFALGWVPMLVVATVFNVVSDTIFDFTWVIILCGWGALLVGAILGWSVGKQPFGPAIAPAIDIRRTMRLHSFFLLLFGIHLIISVQNALPLIQSNGGWGVVFSTGGNLHRMQSLEDSLNASRESLSDNLLAAVINYATFIPGTVAIYTGGVLWKAGHRLIGILPIVLSGGLSVLLLQRTSVVFTFLLFMIGIWSLSLAGVDIPERRRSVAEARMGERPNAERLLNAGKKAASGIVLVATVAAFFLITSSGRYSDGVVFQEGIESYLVSGIAGLNSRNVNGADWAQIPSDVTGEFDPAPGMGGYSFTGLWTVLARVGIPVEPTRVNLDFTDVTLRGQPTSTNVVSALGDFYLDFRLLGVVGMSLMLGFATASLQRKSTGSRSVRLVPAISFLLTFAYWSFFVGWARDLRQLLVAIFGGLILAWAVQTPGNRPIAGSD